MSLIAERALGMDSKRYRLGAAAFALVVGLLLATVSSARAQDGTTVIVHKAECPAGYEGGDLFADCHDARVAGVTFGFLILAPGPRQFTVTDGDGVAIFETSQGALSAGLSITEEPPYDIAEYVVYCTTDAGDPVDINYDEANVGVVFTATNDFNGVSEVVCDWYNIPVAIDGTDDGTDDTDDGDGTDDTDDGGTSPVVTLPNTGIGPAATTTVRVPVLAPSTLAALSMILLLLGVRVRAYRR